MLREQAQRAQPQLVQRVLLPQAQRLQKPVTKTPQSVFFPFSSSCPTKTRHITYICALCTRAHTHIYPDPKSFWGKSLPPPTSPIKSGKNLEKGNISGRSGTNRTWHGRSALGFQHGSGRLRLGTTGPRSRPVQSLQSGSPAVVVPSEPGIRGGMCACVHRICTERVLRYMRVCSI